MVLISDLGGGKTTLAKGLAQGIGAETPVRSPTFTLHHEYAGDKLTMHHFDFYRLFEPGEMRDELAEVLHDPNNVAVVEWGHIIRDVLPLEHLRIEIKVGADDTRELHITYPERLKYLLPAKT